MTRQTNTRWWQVPKAASQAGFLPGHCANKNGSLRMSLALSPSYSELAGKRKESIAGGWDGGFLFCSFEGGLRMSPLKQFLYLILADIYFSVLFGFP